MAFTRDFKDTVVARAQRDPRFREMLFSEGRSTPISRATLAQGRPSCAIWPTPQVRRIGRRAEQAKQEPASNGRPREQAWASARC